MLQNESSLASFVRHIKVVSPKEVLSQLRSDKKLAAVSDQSPDHIGLHLMLTLLFLTAHELGHINNGDNLAAYEKNKGNVVNSKEVSNAVLKMCQHSDDFDRAGFRLPGYNSTPDSALWSPEVQEIRNDFRNRDKQRYDDTVRQFRQEERADQFATQAMLWYLSKLGSIDADPALQQQHLIFETLFVLGIYTWYRDLTSFMDDTCGSFTDSSDLGFCLMQDTQRYIKASEVFHDAHRFMMLRSLLIMRAIIDQRRSTFENPTGHEAALTREALRRLSPKDAVHEIWRLGDLQRYQLISYLMDTPIKLAFAGCATGWYLSKGSPKILTFDFDRLEDALQRTKYQSQSSRSSPETIEAGKSSAEQAIETDSSPYGKFFDAILQASWKHPEAANEVNDPLFKINTDKGTVDFGGRSLNIILTFSCDVGPQLDNLPARKQCVKELLGEFIAHLESKGLIVRRTADNSEPGWVRVLMEARDRRSTKLRFMFESEANLSGTMSYSQVRLVR